MDFSASDLCKRSAAQILYFIKSGNRPQVTDKMLAGCAYQKSIFDEIIANGENAFDEMQGVYHFDDNNIYFCIDIVKDNGFIEVKSLFDENGKETTHYADWYLASSLLQCAVYKSLLMSMDGNKLRTAQFRLDEGAEKREIEVDANKPYYLKFGSVGTFEVKVKNSEAILDFLHKKIESMSDFVTAKAFDKEFRYNEFNILSQYFEYNKI